MVRSHRTRNYGRHADPHGLPKNAVAIIGAEFPVTHRQTTMKISARNVLQGTIVSIVRGPVTTEVTLEIAAGVQIVSTITSNSAESLGLVEGGKAYGVIKASSVMVATD